MSETTSAWSPFRHRVFALMWAAALLGNVGTWMRDVGAGWLMTSLSPSATFVALVQVAGTLPIFMLALPAGTLADLVNRRKLLIGVNLLLGSVALFLGVVTQMGLMTPLLLLGALFVGGIGSALATPVLQSLTPLQVPRPELRAAIALNSMGFNVSRAIGPALGGLVIALLSIQVAFYLDAVSYLIVIAALLWWKAAATPASQESPESFGGALVTGLRYVWNAPQLQRTLLRAASFFLFASCFWALLPLLVRQQLGGSAGTYGWLLACTGVGAVLGALLLPRLRQRLSTETTVRLGTGLTVAVLALLAVTRNVPLAALALSLAGMAWIGVLTSANTAAQMLLPDWVRGRGLAVYLMAFYGSMTAGSLLWGSIADSGGLQLAFFAAACLGLGALVLAYWKPLPEADPDLTPSLHWPEPALNGDAGDRAVQVRIEYNIPAEHRAEFLTRMEAQSRERRRDGALRWWLTEDAERPGRFAEHFIEPSWQEHLRHHHRVTHEDADLQARVIALHRGSTPPDVKHELVAK
ncbi:MFS transporter [Paucibacter sp. M5-1]|uniref:MFS transporter n=1 Tax=Paucibacter sp. M5-1 TaxID=3015998 RepID=UPI0022B87295|nr:MFS transporter [Paucibacter sp. M5-1]MCZ7880616.1 MFS transporter [Paucibacter sp. M5-1]